MSKMYIEKINKWQGIELFKGQKIATILIPNKHGIYKAYNLVGNYGSFNINEKIPLYSSKTQRFLYNGMIREDNIRIVDDNTIGDYIVIK